MTPVFELNDLHDSLQSHHKVTELVRGVSFAVAPGECLGILGESGSGKSMSMKAAMGLLDHSFHVKGSAQFQGEELLGKSAEELRRLRGGKVGIILQNPMTCFDPLYRIGQQIAETFSAHNNWTAEEIHIRSLELLEKMHLMRHKSTRIEKLNASMDQYHTTAVYLKDHIMVLVNVFAITLFQRFALFTATWFVYKAFGLSGTNAFVIILLQSVISVSVDMLPLPGGMGISEKLFSMIFEPVFGSALLIPGMILSRGLGYYTELLISAIFTIVANFTIGRNLRKKA